MLVYGINSNENAKKIAKFINESFHVGEKIPPERYLSKMMNISRSSLRESIQVLKSVGILDSRHGSGIYVVTMPDFYENPAAVFRLNKTEIQEMLEVREALELKAYSLIPKDDFPQMVKRLENNLKEIGNNVNKYDTETFINHDISFHEILRSSSKNTLLSSICNDVSNVVYDERNLMFENKDNIDKSLEYHYKICDAFRQGDRELAKHIYIEHVEIVRRYVQNGDDTF